MVDREDRAPRRRHVLGADTVDVDPPQFENAQEGFDDGVVHGFAHPCRVPLICATILAMTVPSRPVCPGGPALSAVASGCWRLADWHYDTSAVADWIRQSIDLGITTFDHADIYGDYQVTRLFGDALRAQPSLRDRIQIVSKANIALPGDARPSHRIQHYDSSAAHLRRSVEQQLRDLHVDHLDVLLLHRPDPLMDADEVAAAFLAMRDAGLVGHLGVSNFTVGQFDLLASRVGLVTNQVEHSLLALGPMYDGTFDRCQELRIRPMLWSPLGGGRLFSSTEPAAVRVREVAGEMAADYGVSLATLALAWLMAEPVGAIPVVSSSRREGLADAAAACGLTLDRQDWFVLLRAATGTEVP